MMKLTKIISLILLFVVTMGGFTQQADIALMPYKSFVFIRNDTLFIECNDYPVNIPDLASAGMIYGNINTGSITPNLDSVYDLGAANFEFDSIYVETVYASGNITASNIIYIADSTGVSQGSYRSGKAVTDSLSSHWTAILARAFDSEVVKFADSTGVSEGSYRSGKAVTDSLSSHWTAILARAFDSEVVKLADSTGVSQGSYRSGKAVTDSLSSHWSAILARAFDSEVLKLADSTGVSEGSYRSGKAVTDSLSSHWTAILARAFDSEVLKKDGSVALTSNWDAGAYEIRAQTLESDVTTGTAPLTIASTTLVLNLNADLLDGNEASAFEVQLNNEAGLYAVLSDVTQFLENGDNISLLNNDSGYITSTLTDEEVQDKVGAMVTGNTETGITVTYEDGDGTLDFVVSAPTDFTNATDLTAGGALNTNSVSDNEIDYSNVTLNDLTFDIGSVSKTEFGYLNNATSEIQSQINNKAADADVLKKDGSVALTANWDVGDHSVTADKFVASNNTTNALGVLSATGYLDDSGDQAPEGPFTGRVVSNVTGNAGWYPIFSAQVMGGLDSKDFSTISGFLFSLNSVGGGVDFSERAVGYDTYLYTDADMDAFVAYHVGNNYIPNADTSYGLLIENLGDASVEYGIYQSYSAPNYFNADTDIDGSLTVNEAGADKDSRIESDNDTRAFFVDAGDDMAELLVNAPGSDGKYSGLTTTLTVGENVSFGDILYLKSDGKYWKTDADSEDSMLAVAIAVAAITADNSGRCLKQGYVREDDWNWTVGNGVANQLFADDGTAGGMVQNANKPSDSGDILQSVGHVVDANTIYFSPAMTWGEVQ